VTLQALLNYMDDFHNDRYEPIISYFKHYRRVCVKLAVCLREPTPFRRDGGGTFALRVLKLGSARYVSVRPQALAAPGTRVVSQS
jgi:hypothetical protein